MFESICSDKFFLSVLCPGTYIKNKTVTRRNAAHQTIFPIHFLPVFFTFSRKVITIFSTKTILPILPGSPYDVISFLHPFGEQDKQNVLISSKL